MQNDTVKLTSKACPMCQQTVTVDVPRWQVVRYQQGDFVQHAFPDFDADLRERFLTGYCGPCWGILFPEED